MVVPVNGKKIVGLVIVVFLLFWIISRPHDAGDSVNHMVWNLRDAGDSIVDFMNRVL
jgi:hypothetical protein